MPFPSYQLPLFQNECSCNTFNIKNELDLHKSEFLGGAYFHLNCFTHRLVLTESNVNLEMAFTSLNFKELSIVAQGVYIRLTLVIVCLPLQLASDEESVQSFNVEDSADHTGKTKAIT